MRRQIYAHSGERERQTKKLRDAGREQERVTPESRQLRELHGRRKSGNRRGTGREEQDRDTEL